MSGIAGNGLILAADDAGVTERRDDKYRANLRPWVAEVLTPGEMRVLKFLLTGKSLTAIAELKGRSIKTMSTQKIRLYRKLNIVSDLMLYKNLLEQNAITFTKMDNTAEGLAHSDEPFYHRVRCKGCKRSIRS